MDREKLKLTNDEACDIKYGDNPEYEVLSDKIINKGRWSSVNLITIKRLSDDKLFNDTYTEGLTENSDEYPWQHVLPDFKEVFAVEKTVVTYE